MSKIINDDINNLTLENNKRNLEYLSKTAEKMSTKESSSFWRQLGTAVLIDAIPHIPSIVDKVCKFVVPGYVGSQDQQTLAFGMEVKTTTDKYEELGGAKTSVPSAVMSVINAHYPNEIASFKERAKKMAMEAAYAAKDNATNSIGGRLVAEAWGAAAEIGSAVGKHVISEVRADQKSLSSADRKHLREHRRRNADTPVHKSGGRGH